MTRPPARTAVLIGNGAFPQAEGALTPLAAPVHDVSVLAALLADPEVCRFDPPQTLVDRDAKTIKQTLLRTLNGARPQDLVLVYYAGHGKLDGAQLYLCTRDTEPETLAATAVSISEIRDYVSRSPCKQVVLILDCCFSGAAADEFRTRGELSDRIEAAASARGLYLLTSCANHETSVEHVGQEQDDVPYGVYTRMLADGILSGQADVYQDGRITPLELAKYLQSRIPGQTPRVSLIDAEGEEPVLAWTSWAQNDGKRKRVRTRLAQWYADETIPDEVFYQAMGLLGRVPQSELERLRKRLLGMCVEAGWDDVFSRAWAALEAGAGNPAAELERFLTEHTAKGSLAESLYLDAMHLLAAEPRSEMQRRRQRLLTRFGRSPERDVTVLVEAWHALDQRERSHAGDSPTVHGAAGHSPADHAPPTRSPLPPRIFEDGGPGRDDAPRASVDPEGPLADAGGTGVSDDPEEPYDEDLEIRPILSSGNAAEDELIARLVFIEGAHAVPARVGVPPPGLQSKAPESISTEAWIVGITIALTIAVIWWAVTQSPDRRYEYDATAEDTMTIATIPGTDTVSYPVVVPAMDSVVTTTGPYYYGDTTAADTTAM